MKTHCTPQLLTRRVLHLLVALVTVFIPGVPILHAAAFPPQAQQQDSKAFLPTVMNNHCFVKTKTIFGVQMYGDTSRNSQYFSHLQDSNASWVRVPYDWNTIEAANTTPANFTWGTVDAVLGAARDGCVNVVATLEFGAPWAATNPYGPIDKVPLSELGQMMGALVERFDGDGNQDAPGSPVINYWEMYNEPDGKPIRPDAPTWGRNGAKFAEMLGVARTAIKAANPNAQVVMAGIAYDWWEESGGNFVKSFLDDVLKAGGGAHIDIMNFHFYPGFARNWTTSGGIGLIEKTAAIRAKLKSYNLDKPIFITEMGWHNNNVADQPSNDETQSRYVVEMYVQSLAADVKMGTWWPLADAGGTYPYNSGLVTVGPPVVRKPSFAVYVFATQRFMTLVYKRTLPTSETGSAELEVYEFSDSITGRKLYVAWTHPLKDNLNRRLSLPGATLLVRDIYASSSTVTDAADGAQDGKVSVTVGGRPLYLEVLN